MSSGHVTTVAGTLFGRTARLGDVVLAAMAAMLVALSLPGVAAPASAGRIAVVLCALPAGLVALLALAARDRAALVLLTSVVWALFASAVSAAPGLSLLGEYNHRSSAIAWAGAAAVWALARVFGRESTVEWVGWAVVGATALSGAVALAQLVVDPEVGALRLVGGRPTGLASAPVYLGAHAAACCAWFAFRQSRTTSWVNPIGLGLFAMVGSLVGARAAVTVSMAVAVVVMRQVGRRWGGIMLVAGACGVVIGDALHRLVGGSSSAVGRSVAAGGVEDRLRIWWTGVKGWLDHPVVGWGEGRFLVATQGHLPTDFIARGAWADAHNLLVGTLVAQGLVGLVVLVVFVVLAARRAHGAMAWMAAAIGASLLLQPTPPITLALAALLLGVAMREEPPDRREPIVLRTSSLAFLAALGLLVGGSYLWSLRTMMSVWGDPMADSMPRAGVWVSVDPETAGIIANRRATQMVLGDAQPSDVMVWRERAVELDPESARHYGALAIDLAYTGSIDEAWIAAQRALELQDHNLLALRALQLIAVATDDDDLRTETTRRLCSIGALERTEDCPRL